MKALTKLLILVLMTTGLTLVGPGNATKAQATTQVCPIPLEKGTGGFTYINDWHYPRSGGRVHEGNDLFAPEGTPVVAIESGWARIGTGDLGGNVTRVWGDSGWYYYNAHLSAWPEKLASGEKVQVDAGEIIGYVGNTGNALTTPPHLHLQIRPSDTWINPFPYLEQWCTRPVTPPPPPVPGWAQPAFDRALEVGILSPDEAGTDTVQRYELAVTLERLVLMPNTQPTSTGGAWSNGIPGWSEYSMGKAVAAGLLSATVDGTADVDRAVLAVVLNRLGFFDGVSPNAPDGTWNDGIPTWAVEAMGRAVNAGVLAGNVRWSDTVERYELAVVYDNRLDLFEEWLVGTPSWAKPAMKAVVNAGVMSSTWPGNDRVQRYEFAVMLDRLGQVDEDASVAATGKWRAGIPVWSIDSTGRAVTQGLLSATVDGTADVDRAVLAVVLNRLGFFDGVSPNAPDGTWNDGIPTWAVEAMGRAVNAGVLAGNVRWSDTVERYELAVVVRERLGLVD